MGKTVLITGGAGFIGSHLTDHLLEKDHRVRILDDLSPQVHGRRAVRPGYLDSDVELVQGDTPRDAHIRRHGLGEDCPLDFKSPYGCSKGAADQYVLDYSASFGLQTAVFRMSCIYGPHQFGNEDQGWVAHFLIRAAEGHPITLYGNGKQVRDVLFIDDLVDAFLLALADIDPLTGQAFNIGGRRRNALSLLQVIDVLEEILNRTVNVQYADWRPGDQRNYVSNTSRFRRATGWMPKIMPLEGIGRLCNWILENRSSLAFLKGRSMKRVAS